MEGRKCYTLPKYAIHTYVHLLCHTYVQYVHLLCWMTLCVYVVFRGKCTYMYVSLNPTYIHTAHCIMVAPHVWILYDERPSIYVYSTNPLKHTSTGLFNCG